jgi:hypothetical protein
MDTKVLVSCSVVSYNNITHTHLPAPKTEFRRFPPINRIAGLTNGNPIHSKHIDRQAIVGILQAILFPAKSAVFYI